MLALALQVQPVVVGPSKATILRFSFETVLYVLKQETSRTAVVGVLSTHISGFLYNRGVQYPFVT